MSVLLMLAISASGDAARSHINASDQTLQVRAAFLLCLISVTQRPARNCGFRQLEAVWRLSGSPILNLLAIGQGLMHGHLVSVL
jgi:hypothetical protein